MGRVGSAGAAEAEREGSRWGWGESQIVSDPGQKARVGDSGCAHRARERSPVEWKELCRAPEGEQGKGGQERMKKRGMNSKKKKMETEGRARRPPTQLTTAPLPSLTNQIPEQIVTHFREVNVFHVQDRAGKELPGERRVRAYRGKRNKSSFDLSQEPLRGYFCL